MDELLNLPLELVAVICVMASFIMKVTVLLVVVVGLRPHQRLTQSLIGSLREGRGEGYIQGVGADRQGPSAAADCEDEEGPTYLSKQVGTLLGASLCSVSPLLHAEHYFTPSIGTFFGVDVFFRLKQYFEVGAD